MNDLLFVVQNFEPLLKKVDLIYKKISKVENEKIQQNELTLYDALIFLNSRGIVVSKSQMYKLTSAKKIPFCKFGKRLVFKTNDLLDWIQSRITEQNNQEGQEIIVNSSIRKLGKSHHYEI